MVRMIDDSCLDFGLHYCTFAGKSTDDKPVSGTLATGSEFFEIDTGKTYYYDEEADAGSEWVDPTA